MINCDNKSHSRSNGCSNKNVHEGNKNESFELHFPVVQDFRHVHCDTICSCVRDAYLIFTVMVSLLVLFMKLSLSCHSLTWMMTESASVPLQIFRPKQKSTAEAATTLRTQKIPLLLIFRPSTNYKSIQVQMRRSFPRKKDRPQVMQLSSFTLHQDISVDPQKQTRLNNIGLPKVGSRESFSSRLRFAWVRNKGRRQNFATSLHSTKDDSNSNVLMIRKNTIHSFISVVNQSIHDGSFASLTIRGPSKLSTVDKKKHKNDDVETKTATKHCVSAQNKNNNENLRGSLRLVTGRLISLPRNNNKFRDDQIIKLQVTFKYHYATDIVKNWNIHTDVTKGLEILFDIRSSKNEDGMDDCGTIVPKSEWGPTTIAIQSATLQTTTQYTTATTLNPASKNELKLDLRSPSTNGKYSKIPLAAQLYWKNHSNCQDNKKSSTKLFLEKSIGNSTNEFSTSLVNDTGKTRATMFISTHDRIKQFPVPVTEDFWRLLGITSKTRDGKIVREMSSKFKQCQKFVEIVDRLLTQRIAMMRTIDRNVNNSTSVKATEAISEANIIKKSQIVQPESSKCDMIDDLTNISRIIQNQQLQPKQDHQFPLHPMETNKAKEKFISVVDMGCGRGYLTFALHSFLQTKYPGIVQSLGIDVRPKLVQEINIIAQSLGTKFQDSLHFETGTIEKYMVQQGENQTKQEKIQTFPDVSSINVLIALHACDTATDDAIWCGIVQGADVIVVAPCCHQEIRSQLDVHTKTCGRNHILADVFRHNIYRERIAETVTDSLRALLLELAGYSTQVFEFIGGEHTSKNVMITGVRQQHQKFRLPLPQEKQYSHHDSGTTSIICTKKQDLRNRIRTLASLHGIREQRLVSLMKETDLLQPSSEDIIQYTITTPKTSRNMSLTTKRMQNNSKALSNYSQPFPPLQE